MLNSLTLEMAIIVVAIIDILASRVLDILQGKKYSLVLISFDLVVIFVVVYLFMRGL